MGDSASNEDMEQFVSSIVSDSGDSLTSGPATIQLLAGPSQPIVSSFQKIPAKFPPNQGRIGTSSFGAPILKDGWMKYPMPNDASRNGNSNAAMFNNSLDSPKPPSVRAHHSTTPECSSYADVARGSISTTVQANLCFADDSENVQCSRPRMQFENFVELGKPTHAVINASNNAVSSQNLASLQTSGDSNFVNSPSFHSLPQAFPNNNFLKDQSSLMGGYKFGGSDSNPYHPKNGYHKGSSGGHQFQSHPKGFTFADPTLNKQPLLYPTDCFLRIMAQNVPQNVTIPPNLPSSAQNIPCNNVYQAHGHKSVPWYRPTNDLSSNAMLYQASGITGLPPVPPNDLLSAFPNSKSHITSFQPTLDGSLSDCYHQLQDLEKERKVYEIELCQKFMGKRITSSNGIAVTPLAPDPSPVDRLICDMYKEYNRIITLTSKIGGLTREGLNASIEQELDKWSDAIQKVEGHRKAELSHHLRKLSPESVKELYRPGNSQIAKLQALAVSTRRVRTALWLITQHTLHSAGPGIDNG